jgi:hypothetical protein
MAWSSSVWLLGTLDYLVAMNSTKPLLTALITHGTWPYANDNTVMIMDP